MYKMIIADDEPLITRGLQKFMNFGELGFDILGVYQDGQNTFDAIVEKKPDIALLDISMPEMDGIEIIKKIHAMSLPTKVIFISGFQDFEYAKAAIKYGAVDYLLKPVIKKELISALEKALSVDLTGIDNEKKPLGWQRNMSVSTGPSEEGYITALAAVCYEESLDDKARKLKEFSLKSFLMEYFEEKKYGIVFSKNNNIVLVINGKHQDEMQEVLSDVKNKSEQYLQQKFFFIVGDFVKSMQEIDGEYIKCLKYKDHVYFAPFIPGRVIDVHYEVLVADSMMKDYEEYCKKVTTAILSKSKENLEFYYNRLVHVIFQLSGCKREDACFYFCSYIYKVNEKISAITGEDYATSMSELLQDAKGCISYMELIHKFKNKLMKYIDCLSNGVAGEGDAMSIAIKYIDEHYMEDVSLNIMADVVHMNPYYFSSYFKKKNGENFKDYLNRVRVDRAMPFLISSDKKMYEIATLVGFSDVRSFSDAFQKIYGEKPKAYRKK